MKKIAWYFSVLSIKNIKCNKKKCFKVETPTLMSYFYLKGLESIWMKNRQEAQMMADQWVHDTELSPLVVIKGVTTVIKGVTKLVCWQVITDFLICFLKAINKEECWPLTHKVEFKP